MSAGRNRGSGDGILLAKTAMDGMPAKTKVLVVDDQEPLRRFIAKLLSKAGYEAIEAADGHEALRIYRTNPGAVVIADVVMPGMGGIELISSLQREDGRVRALLISGAGDCHSLLHTLPRPAPFLRKPFAPAELLRAVEELLAADMTLSGGPN